MKIWEHIQKTWRLILGSRDAGLKKERDELARALFRIRRLTMTPDCANQTIAEIACEAVRDIDETRLFGCMTER